MGTTMKAIRYHAYGGPEQLRYEDAPVPTLKAGEVLVRVRATSVNPWDYKLASGAFRNFVPMDFPYTPGGEFAGQVEAVGKDVDHVKPGEAVYGNCPQGSYAQFVVAPASSVAHKPSSLTELQAASVPLAAQTAFQGLFDHGHLEAGQTVLIHAAAGGVGTFAVQLAHWKGAKVIATASAANADYLKSLGADQVIDYKSTPFDTVVKDVDVVLDLLGGETQTRSFAVLKQGGRLVATSQPPDQELASRHKVSALMMQMKPTAERLKQLAQLLDAGNIRTEVTKTFPLSQAKEAWEYSKSGHTRGKIVLEVPA
jgi:NADPH:quinone reductase-like Zn-dependent oxidoreductase